MNRFSFALVVALAAGALAAVPDDATGCAAVVHLHNGQRVDTADESALIVWDEKTKTEHFVRRASFRSTGYDFGFLVPTPNRPHLDVASDDLFGDLATITAPKVERREVVTEVEREFSLGCAAEKKSFMYVGSAVKPPSDGVQVLEQKRIGNYDVTVLAFHHSDGDTPEGGARLLGEWLAKHGYERSPAIDKWLAKYVRDQWCITAFKIAAPDKPNETKPPAGRHDLQAKPVRMSFRAEKPFYPYREPEPEPGVQPSGESRFLRVFFAAQGRYAGQLGDGSKAWPGQTVWAGPGEEASWAGVFQKAKLSDAPKDGKPVASPKAADGWWLTEFEDRSSPRPGIDEVYFEPSADQSPVARAPIIVETARTVEVTPWRHVAVYFGVPAVLVGFLVWRRFQRG
ncbi:DUF2330 domain-containing protein [Frigoriglobus tundricola]|uniref:DUF2330 domain-containing protein n=1 Tax=Frigoriglobus tundricola TaxID=2774151 RepID=A0A6M5YWT6_9BACT|nr:DUF2330 domain-containing protein [Frigoriglobus tundricola]QJW97856.1 hypothetical protein FTUN_5436 [Frigoriglobus tundricola]